VRRALALAAGLVAAALALWALFGGSPPPAPDEEIDDASRRALEEVLRQEDE
jgi:hypothetical protein